MSKNGIRSIVEGLDEVRSVIAEEQQVEAEDGGEAQPSVEEEEDPAPDEPPPEGEDETASADGQALESWITPMARIATNTMVGSWVSQRFASRARLAKSENPAAPHGLPEEMAAEFRRFAGLPLNEDSGPSKEDIEAVAFLATIGEMIETDLRDMLVIDDATIGSVVESLGGLFEDADAIEEAAQAARHRGTGQAVLEVARDPAARQLAMEAMASFGQQYRAWVEGGHSVDEGKSMKPGGGGRFAALKAKLAKKKGISNPGAVAAAIGRHKYGKKKMGEFSGKGRHRAAMKRHEEEETPEEGQEPELSERVMKLKHKLATFTSHFQNARAKGARKPGSHS